MEIQQLKTNLNEFLTSIKFIRIDEFDEKTKQAIYLDYKELYQAYSQLPKREINKNFTENEIKAIDCLSLGIDNNQKFNRLLEKFQKDNATSILNVVDFIKSREGFELINSDGDFSKFSDEELVDIFGGIFGIQVAKDSVKALKAEKVGRVVGYALSELFSTDLAEFKKLKKQDSKLDLCDFLRDKIQKQDYECSYLYNENGNDLEIQCSINEQNNASITEVRGRNRVDHCFINHKTKMIVFGQSTSNKDTETQGYSHFKAHLTLAHLVHRETIDGKENPYYGYKLMPYLMLGGRFVVDDQNITQEQGRDFKKMLPNTSKEDLKKLAQMQYFRIFGNSVNSAQVESLSQFNVFIAGCDTLNLYEFSEKMAFLNSKEKQKLSFSFITKQLTDVCNILSKNELSFASGGKTDLLLILNDVHSTASQLFSNFNQELSKKSYNENIKPLYESIANLRTKIEPIAGQFGNTVVNNLRILNKSFASVESYNEEIKDRTIAKVQNVTWKETPKKASDLTPQNVLEVGLYIKSHMGTQGQKVFDKFLKALNNKINKGIDLDDYESKRFSVEKYHFLNEYGYEPAGIFLDRAGFLLNKRLTEETMEARTKDLYVYISRHILPHNPELQEKILGSTEGKTRKSKP